MQDFEVTGSGNSYAVYEAGGRVSPFCSSRDGAFSYIPGLERKRRRETAIERPCLCCSTIILSEGPHHRLCDDCRRSA